MTEKESLELRFKRRKSLLSMADGTGKTVPGDRANVSKNRRAVGQGSACVGEELGKFEYLHPALMFNNNAASGYHNQ